MRRIILSLAIFLTGCTTVKTPDTPYQLLINSWRGTSIQTLEEAWGAPELITTENNGLRKFTFVEKKRVINGDQAETTLIKCTTVFDVERNNTILSARADGELCNREDFINKTAAHSS